jgi:hypothetical protein
VRGSKQRWAGSGRAKVACLLFKRCAAAAAAAAATRGARRRVGSAPGLAADSPLL